VERSLRSRTATAIKRFVIRNVVNANKTLHYATE
jgi:hypothetical protein